MGHRVAWPALDSRLRALVSGINSDDWTKWLWRHRKGELQRGAIRTTVGAQAGKAWAGAGLHQSDIQWSCTCEVERGKGVAQDRGAAPG